MTATANLVIDLTGNTEYVDQHHQVGCVDWAPPDLTITLIVDGYSDRASVLPYIREFGPTHNYVVQGADYNVVSVWVEGLQVCRDTAA